MSRHPQHAKGARGSLKWMLRAANDRPSALQPRPLPPLNWVSPCAGDDYAEYRDADALAVLGLAHLTPDLIRFWPRRGPQWDGLATFEGGVVLAEAKAHLPEIASPPSKAGPASAAQITAACAQVKKALGVDATRAWDQTYYQYANRLAHLWWLRSKGVNAHLLLIGFLGDHDMTGPTAASAWTAAYDTADRALGLAPNHALTPYIHHLCPDVRTL